MKKDIKDFPYYLVKLKDKKEEKFLIKFLNILGYEINSKLTFGLPVVVRKDKKQTFNANITTMAALSSGLNKESLEKNILSLEEFIKKCVQNKDEELTK